MSTPQQKQRGEVLYILKKYMTALTYAYNTKEERREKHVINADVSQN